MDAPCPLPNFDFRVQHAVVSHPGKRAENQDAWTLAPQLALFALADGMGGHSDGAAAARLALDALVSDLSSTVPTAAAEFARRPHEHARSEMFRALRGAFERANSAVFELGRTRNSPLGMGTTLDALLLVRDRAFVAHVGDGRLYVSRPSAFIQVTHDHALHDTLLASGMLANTPSPTQRRRGAHGPLVRAVGLGRELTVDTCFFEVRRGDRIVLCTDGVHNEMSEAEMGATARQGTAQQTADRIVAEAIARGGRDNATAVVVEVRERFVHHSAGDRDAVPSSGPVAGDIDIARQSELLSGLAEAQLLRLLAASVEIEIGIGEQVSRIVANDWVSYIVIRGQVALGPGVVLGAAGWVFPESLAGVGLDGPLPTVIAAARLLRVRANDFAEVCAADAELGMLLFQRLARHLARTR